MENRPEGKRLNKFIADSGYCSRREADRLITEGRVLLDGRPGALGDRVLEGMDAVDFDPFPLALEGFGRFGDLWWAGLAKSEPLNALVRRLRRALAENDIPFDRKRFSPHITLVRKGVFDGKPPAVEVPRVEMTVDRFSLMRSDRGKRGMIYTELGGKDAR